MKEELIKLLDKAYAPYSKFHVSCIVEMKDGKFIPGVNVENASYGATLCAERNAISSAIAFGETSKILKIAIYSPKSKKCYPCGACRQWIQEFENGGCYVISNRYGTQHFYPWVCGKVVVKPCDREQRTK